MAQADAHCVGEEEGGRQQQGRGQRVEVEGRELGQPHHEGRGDINTFEDYYIASVK